MKQKMPLTMVRPGQKVKLLAVNAGRGLKSRLASMGLVPGVELVVMNSAFAGPLLVSVKDSRIMLGRGLAQKIMVR